MFEDERILKRSQTREMIRSWIDGGEYWVFIRDHHSPGFFAAMMKRIGGDCRFDAERIDLSLVPIYGALISVVAVKRSDLEEWKVRAFMNQHGAEARSPEQTEEIVILTLTPNPERSIKLVTALGVWLDNKCNALDVDNGDLYTTVDEWTVAHSAGRVIRLCSDYVARCVAAGREIVGPPQEEKPAAAGDEDPYSLSALNRLRGD